jgi:hypothetical protein
MRVSPERFLPKEEKFELQASTKADDDRVGNIAGSSVVRIGHNPVPFGRGRDERWRAYLRLGFSLESCSDICTRTDAVGKSRTGNDNPRMRTFLDR